MRTVILCSFLCAVNGQDPDAAAIMARVASNMESASEARRQYVYQQKVKARLLRTNGQVARQEDHVYTAIPTEDRTNKELVSFAGEYHKSKKEIIKYDKPGFEKGGMDIDGGIIEDLVSLSCLRRPSIKGVPRIGYPSSRREKLGPV